MRWSPSGERDERGWDGAAQQGFACLPLGGGIEGCEKLHLATGKERYRQAAAVEQAVTGQRGEFWPGGQDAREIQSSEAGLRRISRSMPTASGSANCSPEKPATKRPPRISPRASSRR